MKFALIISGDSTYNRMFLGVIGVDLVSWLYRCEPRRRMAS